MQYSALKTSAAENQNGHISGSAFCNVSSTVSSLQRSRTFMHASSSSSRSVLVNILMSMIETERLKMSKE